MPSDSLSPLRDIADPNQLQQNGAPMQRPRVNSHIHLPPNFSAFETLQQAVDLAAAQEIGVLGVSNYYDYSVYNDFMDAARASNIFPLFGIEIISLVDDLVRAGVKINDPGNPGKMYICGKGITRFSDMTAAGQELLDLIRRNDSQRMAEMATRIAELFAATGIDTGLDEAAITAMVVRRHGSRPETVYLQERHIAQAFQEAFFERVPIEQRAARLEAVFGTAANAPDDAVAVQNDIRSHLMKAGKPGYIDETFVSFEQAHQLILELGGIPCYPVLADGTKPLTNYENPVEQLIENTRARNIFCAEFIPLRNTPGVLRQYVEAMRAAGIVVTAGTEHNTLELVPIEPTCVGGEPIPDDLKDIFWEGACVVAAHQHLTLHGQTGFVDAQGNLNPDYNSDEERIAAFSKMGAALIGRYQQANA